MMDMIFNIISYRLNKDDYKWPFRKNIGGGFGKTN